MSRFAQSKLLQFKLVAEIKDEGEGVLTGKKRGETGFITRKEYENGELWVWVSIGDETSSSEAGWAPRSHIALLN